MYFYYNSKIPLPFREGLENPSDDELDLSAFERTGSNHSKTDSPSSALLALLLMEFISQ